MVLLVFQIVYQSLGEQFGVARPDGALLFVDNDARRKVGDPKGLEAGVVGVESHGQPLIGIGGQLRADGLLVARGDYHHLEIAVEEFACEELQVFEIGAAAFARGVEELDAGEFGLAHGPFAVEPLLRPHVGDSFADGYILGVCRAGERQCQRHQQGSAEYVEFSSHNVSDFGSAKHCSMQRYYK